MSQGIGLHTLHLEAKVISLSSYNPTAPLPPTPVATTLNTELSVAPKQNRQNVHNGEGIQNASQLSVAKLVFEKFQ